MIRPEVPLAQLSNPSSVHSSPDSRDQTYSTYVAGSVWNLWRIEWIRLQLNHPGYPLYYAYISGVWQIAGAAAIIAPRFERIKEWAYAGAFFTWSGAVPSHLFAADGAAAWSPALMFATFGIISLVLRPADRRLPDAGPVPGAR